MGVMHTDQSRAEFEHWAIGEYISVNRSLDRTDGYFDGDSQIAWNAWQASRATTEQSSGVELPEPELYSFDEQASLIVGDERKFTRTTYTKIKPDEPHTGWYTEQQVRALLAAAPQAHQTAWLPIESAPRDKTILLGYRNSHGHWRTLRGEWFSREEIDEMWEEPDGVEPGWFETSVEADDVPNVWRTNPTHWMPLPQPPKEQT